MIVDFPANVNDGDPTSVLPANMATDMTCSILRIRLSEVCRKVADAIPLGSCEINDLPYDQILTISRLFDEAYNCIPPCYALSTPIPPDAPPAASTERRVIHLGFHARRARIFRPFLLTRPHHQRDPRFSQFRALCLHSARVVLDVASGLVREGLEGGKARTQWSGCVISHLFIACVVLVTHPTLASHNADSETLDPEAEDIRAELTDARRLLERAAGVSSVAGNLVRKLVDVLKRHRVLAAASTAAVPTADKAVDRMTPFSTSGSGYLSGSTPTVVNDGVDSTVHASAWLPTGGTSTGLYDGVWDFGGGYQPQPHLDELEWADLVGAAYPDVDGWSQLFADLDAAFPAPL
jgi:hypothetical protein